MRVVLLLVLLAVAGCAGPRPGRPLEDWEYTDVEPSRIGAAPDRVPEGLIWRPAPRSRLVRGDGTRAMWARTHVTCEPGWRDPVVFIPKAYVGLDAYLDGKRTGVRRSYRYASGTPWYAIPIPCPARTAIVLRLESSYTQVGFPQAPVVGERAVLVESLFRRDAPRIVLAVVFLLIGLTSGLLAVGRRDRRAMIGLSIYGVGLAGWTLFHTRTKQLWQPTMELWFDVWWVSVPLISWGVVLFVEGFFGPGRRRALRWLARSLALVTAASAASLVLHDARFIAVATPIFAAGRALLVIGVVLVTVHLTRLARHGDREAGLLLMGFALAFLAVLRDVSLSLGWITGEDTWAQYGYAAFGVTLVLLVRRRVVRMQRELVAHADALERYVRERELLMRDLHDGLGGIVTNVRMLAERGVEEERSGGVLNAIAKLAGDGITELRSLISGFDGPPQTWRQVAGELRRAGALAVEAHDIRHLFTPSIDEGASPPELTTVVHLLRVHREAVTNALKHAGASRLDVALTVTPDGIELVIADDGSDAADGDVDLGVGMGRGLASMRARARVIGGELSISQNEGTTVRLEVPLGSP